MSGLRDAGILLYRCRRCGEIITGFHTPSCMVSLIDAMLNKESSFGKGFQPKMFELHTCDDGHQGLCDLIGGKLDNTDNNVRV